MPPDALLRLVDRFSQDHKVFLSPDYKEEQLRAEFLDPFFTALGWDIDSKQGLSETLATQQKLARAVSTAPAQASTP